MKRAALWLAVFGLALGGALRAQDDDEAGRGVARISVLAGDVSVRRGDSGDWVAAALNAPLMAGDTLSTNAGARAEVQFDSANMIRVASDAEVEVAQLDDGRYIVQLARGTATFRVLRDSTAQVELNTPSVSIRPVQQGVYRVTVRDGGDTEITVRAGEVEIFTPTGSEHLRPGHTMHVRGTASDPEFRLVAEIPRDSWDDWNVTRDRRLEQSQSYRYADRTVYGVEDLDDYGTWVSVSDYGYVWSPRVAVGWSPYYDGRWAWVDYYGWTWISYDPWGWAPYHYGRWFWNTGYGWCWWPGGHGVRHHWSPALVAFFGYGHGGVGIGFGYGRVGWVPLGPHEPYHRWYGRDFYRGYRNGGFPGDHMGMQRDYDVRRNYRNARAPNGMAGMDADGFGRGGRAARLGAEDVTRAGLVRGMLPVAPSRESQRLSDRELNRTAANVGGAGRSFAGHTQIRRADRVSFEDQRRSLERGIQNAAASRQGGPGGANNSMRSGPAAVGADRGTSGPRESVDRESGWRRLGDAGTPAVRRNESAAGSRASRPSQDASPGAETRGSWRTFGRQTGSSDAAAPAANRSAEREAVRPGSAAATRESAGRESSGATRGSEAGWRTFENRPERSSGSGAAQESRGQAGSQTRERESSRPLKINPPLVRERPNRSDNSSNYSAPRTQSEPRWSGPSGGSFGETRRSAPAYSGPSSTPRGDYGSVGARPSYSGSGGSRERSLGSARSSGPSYSGGGGGRVSAGGGSRPSGGGGGARPSGGGGRPSGGGRSR